MVLQALNFLIIVGSALIKLPQIYNIYFTRDIVHLSYAMFFMENYCYGVALVYHARNDYELVYYVENAVLLAATTIITAQFACLESERKAHYGYLSIAQLLFFYILASRTMEEVILAYNFSMLVNIACRVPQAHLNFKNKSTGDLDFLMIAGSIVGNAVRIATTVEYLNSDIRILATVVSVLFINVVILFQMAFYHKHSQPFVAYTSMYSRCCEWVTVLRRRRARNNNSGFGRMQDLSEDDDDDNDDRDEYVGVGGGSITAAAPVELFQYDNDTQTDTDTISTTNTPVAVDEVVVNK